MERFFSNIWSSKWFSYDKLQDAKAFVRLLELQPSDQFDHEIHCTIHATAISSCPPYKALSYSWGANVRNRSIIMGGKMLRITSSLEIAMRHLRGPKEPITLWIDQICIDQDNLDERNDQVPLMAQIYRQAEQVLIWLGPAAGGSDKVMDLFAQVGERIFGEGLDNYCNRANSPTLSEAVSRRDPKNHLWQKAEGVIDLAMRLWLPCLKEMANWGEREWFTRVWVIQEFCFGTDPRFICGRKNVPVDFVKTTRQFMGLGVTDDFVSMVRSMHGDQALAFINGHDPSPALFSARSWTQRSGSAGETLPELLRKVYVGRAASATNPADRIFSLLNLVTDRLEIKVNYKMSYTEVLKGAARAIITKTGTLNVLSYAQMYKDLQDLPTWVPDWRSNLRPSFYYYPPAGLENEHLFAPTGNRPLKVWKVVPDAILAVDGFQVDMIERVGDVWMDNNSSERFNPLYHLPVLAEICFFCQLSAAKNRCIYASKQRRDEAEWRIPIADVWETRESGVRERAGERAKRALDQLHKLMAWFDHCSVEMDVVGTWRYGDAPDDYEPSMYRLSMSKMSGMRPFLTVQGYIGWGPPLMCPGDVVVCLFGSRVCSVLRRQQYLTAPTENRYFYVGEAYCDGVMKEELLGYRDKETFYIV